MELVESGLHIIKDLKIQDGHQFWPKTHALYEIS